MRTFGEGVRAGTVMLVCLNGAAHGAAADESPFSVVAPSGTAAVAEPANREPARESGRRGADVDPARDFLSYHGVLVDGTLTEIELDESFVDRAQDALLGDVAAALGKSRVEALATLEKTLFADRRLERLDRPRLKSRLIEVWLDELDARRGKGRGTEIARRWRERHAALRLNLPDALELDGDRERRLKTLNGLSTAARLALSELEREYRWKWLRSLTLDVYALIPVSWYSPPDTAYMSDCRAAGVPIPPDWGDSRWEYQGVLDEEFIDAYGIATVYAYRSTEPEGSCIALPRTSPITGRASVFGIICLGIETEHACFWDKYETTAAELAGDIPIQRWISGDDFTGTAGNCSSCHAGENPFVIHPDTPLDVAAQGFPTRVDWHHPHFPPTWPTNPGPLTSLPSDTTYSTFDIRDSSTWFAPEEPGSSCIGCHKLPDVAHPTLRQEGYCDSVLRNAARDTMPPDSADPLEHPAGWGPGNGGDYRAHVDALAGLCD